MVITPKTKRLYTHEYSISSLGVLHEVSSTCYTPGIVAAYFRLNEPTPVVLDNKYTLRYITKNKKLSTAQEIELKSELFAHKKWKEIRNPINIKYIYTHILAIRRGKIRMFTIQSPVICIGIEYTRFKTYPDITTSLLTKDINLYFSRYHVRKPNFTMVKLVSWGKELDGLPLITMYRILYDNYLYLKKIVWKK